MTDRITIADLRIDAAQIIDSGGITHGLVLVDPDDLTALIDLAEASNDWHALAEYGEAPDSVDLRLHAALARFDFDEPA